jgi:hypothetical protein
LSGNIVPTSPLFKLLGAFSSLTTKFYFWSLRRSIMDSIISLSNPQSCPPLSL